MRGLVQAGAHVVVADLTEEGCKARVDDRSKQLGGKAGFCTVDVTSRESIENLLAETLQQTGRADILVNSAGRERRQRRSSMPPRPTGTASWRST